MKTLDEWITERCKALGMGFDDLASAAGITRDTLYRIRNGHASYAKTIRNLEAALGWALGSIEKIKAGGEPTVVDVEQVLRAASPPRLYQDPVTKQPAYGQLLRDVRRAMGEAAFWREIGAMEQEERAG